MSAHAQWDEGHTIAGWTGCVLAVTGSAVAGVGVAIWRPMGVWLGVGVMVAAALLTWVLHLAGWGKPGGVRPRGQWGMRTRDLSARQGHPGCLGCRLAGRQPKPAAAAFRAGPAGRTGPAGPAGCIGGNEIPVDVHGEHAPAVTVPAQAPAPIRTG
ncbi:hypothetical protein FHS42_004136 [Streptomyces zagrosensis]|uniref:Uncharacterized protein n=1 Tax=Streptomyces zagrosensis TaxID=1042984 RepID=A0A7W9QDL9_9ACTN|nr:hypothetical protein [Streptomyces zagrosensis]